MSDSWECLPPERSRQFAWKDGESLRNYSSIESRQIALSLDVILIRAVVLQIGKVGRGG